MNVSEFKLLLTAADLANDTVIVESLHGIGKSDSVRDFAKANNYYCQELFLSMMDPSDMLGMPRTVNVGTSTITTWAETDWFQRITDAAFPQISRISDLVFADPSFAEVVKARTSATIDRVELNTLYTNHYDLVNDRLHIVAKDSTVHNATGRRSVLFLDELNRAALDTRQAALQLVLNKEIHSHKLPYIQGLPTFIVAAINPADTYQVDELDAALLDRFLHCELKADTKEWLTWARSQNLNSMVQDFLAEHPDRLHWTPKDGGIGSTPRSWAKLAAYMDRIDSTPKELHFTVFKGKIGSELGGQFLSFYNNYSKVIKLEDIEAAVAKAAKRSTNPEVIAKPIVELIEKQEAVQKSTMADILYDKYVVNNPDGDAASAMTLVAYLYALDIELLAAFFKQRKDTDFDNYLRLAKYDHTLNDKKLFNRIVAKLS